METAPRIQRFSPQTATLDEAYDRGTRTPREVRQLAETLLAWELSNLMHDCVSPLGDLPRRFGFDCDRDAAAPLRGAPYHIALTAIARLYVFESRIVCSHGSGLVLVSADRFELLQLPGVLRSDSPSSAVRGLRPTTPQHWILGWACLGRSFS